MNMTSTEMEAKIGNVVYLVLNKKKIDAHKIVKELNDELLLRLTQFTIEKSDTISLTLRNATDKDGVMNVILIERAIKILKEIYELEKNNLSKEDQDIIKMIIEDAQKDQNGGSFSGNSNKGSSSANPDSGNQKKSGNPKTFGSGCSCF